jgi:hypothetical protein
MGVLAAVGYGAGFRVSDARAEERAVTQAPGEDQIREEIKFMQVPKWTLRSWRQPRLGTPLAIAGRNTQNLLIHSFCL